MVWLAKNQTTYIKLYVFAKPNWPLPQLIKQYMYTHVLSSTLFFLRGRLIEINKLLKRIVEKVKRKYKTKKRAKDKIHDSRKIVLSAIELMKPFSLSSITT